MKRFCNQLSGSQWGREPSGEAEFSEERFEIEAVVVGDVPEHRLEVAGAGGLVDGIDDLFEAIGDHLVDGALFERSIHDFIGAEVVVRAVFLLEEVAHVHQELNCGDGAAEHGADDEHHVDESATKRFEVGGCRRVTADGLRAVEQPRIHRDGSAVIGERSFVVLVDIVVIEEIEISDRRPLFRTSA